MNLKNQRVVLIADPVKNHSNCTIENDDLECPNMEYFDEVFLALKQIVQDVIWYKNPSDFIDHIAEHKKDIVWSIWSGKGNHYRKGLVPSICEAYGIQYVGADPFVQLLCQDKHLSKLYCEEFLIKSAKGVHIKTDAEIKKVNDLDFPLIIKPNAEGGSNGISQDNIVKSPETAAELCRKLLPIFNHDLIAEEYIPGIEITTVLAGSDKNNLLMKQNKVLLDETSPYTIWGFETKKIDGLEAEVKPIDILNEQTKAKFVDLFFSFEKVELIRIDGRIHNGEYYMLELSPDVCMDSTGSVATAFSQVNIPYGEMFEKILENTINYYDARQ